MADITLLDAAVSFSIDEAQSIDDVIAQARAKLEAFVGEDHLLRLRVDTEGLTSALEQVLSRVKTSDAAIRPRVELGRQTLVTDLQKEVNSANLQADVEFRQAADAKIQAELEAEPSLEDLVKEAQSTVLRPKLEIDDADAIQSLEEKVNAANLKADLEIKGAAQAEIDARFAAQPGLEDYVKAAEKANKEQAELKKSTEAAAAAARKADAEFEALGIELGRMDSADAQNLAIDFRKADNAAEGLAGTLRGVDGSLIQVSNSGHEMSTRMDAASGRLGNLAFDVVAFADDLQYGPRAFINNIPNVIRSYNLWIEAHGSLGAAFSNAQLRFTRFIDAITVAHLGIGALALAGVAAFVGLAKSIRGSTKEIDSLLDSAKELADEFDTIRYRAADARSQSTLVDLINDELEARRKVEEVMGKQIAAYRNMKTASAGAAIFGLGREVDLLLKWVTGVDRAAEALDISADNLERMNDEIERARSAEALEFRIDFGLAEDLSVLELANKLKEQGKISALEVDIAVNEDSLKKFQASLRDEYGSITDFVLGTSGDLIDDTLEQIGELGGALSRVPPEIEKINEQIEVLEKAKAFDPFRDVSGVEDQIAQLKILKGVLKEAFLVSEEQKEFAAEADKVLNKFESLRKGVKDYERDFEELGDTIAKAMDLTPFTGGVDQFLKTFDAGVAKILSGPLSELKGLSTGSLNVEIGGAEEQKALLQIKEGGDAAERIQRELLKASKNREKIDNRQANSLASIDKTLSVIASSSSGLNVQAVDNLNVA